MTYKITSRSINNILQFYKNVAKKYKHSYSKELMNKNIDDAINAMYQIEVSLLRRQPSINSWKSKAYYMANFKKWYYAYIIQGDNIIITDSRHAQNMQESFTIRPSQLCRIIQESINKVLKNI